MKKIRIVTFTHAHNYGAMLQAFALQKKISNNKYEVKFLNYRNEIIENAYKVFQINKKNLKTTIKSFIKSVIFCKKNIERYNKCNAFESKFLNFEEVEYKDIGTLRDYNNADILIAGSDQIWNVNITHGLSDVYTLNFGNDNIKRISYAASSGSSSIVEENSDILKKKLQKFDYISVREEELNYTLSKIMEKNIFTALDPTLLLKRNEWDNTLKGIESKCEKYIVAYVVQPNDEYIKIVNYLSDKTGLRVIHFGQRNPGYKNVLKNAYTEGPLEFINYIKNAEYVVATSFHATVFSIIYNKKFFIVPHIETGSRVTNLLDKLNIKNRTFNSLERFQNIDYDLETNWNKVNEVLEFEREKSLKWLTDAIEL